MGQDNSHLVNPPHNGVLLPITWGAEKPGDCGSRFVAICEKPFFDYPKPWQLEPALSDQAWQAFHSEVLSATKQMWRIGTEILPILLIFPVFVLSLGIMDASDDDEFEEPHGSLAFRHVVSLFLPIWILIFITFALRYYIISVNEELDHKISAACSRLSGETGLFVEYRKIYTGFCRPKGKHPFRAVAIAAPGPMLVRGIVVE